MELARRINGNLANARQEAFQPHGGEASGNLSNTPLHLADLATDNYEQEFFLSQLENQTQSLNEVNEALARLDQKTYGICERCEKAISIDRLKAMPATRFCIQCARTEEDETQGKGMNYP